MICRILVAALVLWTPVSVAAQSANYAENPDLLSCLQEHLPISNVKVEVTEEAIDVRFDLSRAAST